MKSLYQQMMGSQASGATTATAAKIDPNILSQAKQMLGMLQNCGDPQKALNMLAQNNPQMGALMNMIGGSGMSAKGMFMQMAKQKGIDPNTIINALK